jgi:hypothetical protein
MGSGGVEGDAMELFGGWGDCRGGVEGGWHGEGSSKVRRLGGGEGVCICFGCNNLAVSVILSYRVQQNQGVWQVYIYKHYHVLQCNGVFLRFWKTGPPRTPFFRRKFAGVFQGSGKKGQKTKKRKNGSKTALHRYNK